MRERGRGREEIERERQRGRAGERERERARERSTEVARGCSEQVYVTGMARSEQNTLEMSISAVVHVEIIKSSLCFCMLRSFRSLRLCYLIALISASRVLVLSHCA